MSTAQTLAAIEILDLPGRGGGGGGGGGGQVKLNEFNRISLDAAAATLAAAISGARELANCGRPERNLFVRMRNVRSFVRLFVYLFVRLSVRPSVCLLACVRRSSSHAAGVALQRVFTLIYVYGDASSRVA